MRLICEANVLLKCRERAPPPACTTNRGYCRSFLFFWVHGPLPDKIDKSYAFVYQIIGLTNKITQCSAGDFAF